MKEKLLWIVIVILAAGMVSSTIRLNKLEDKLEQQEVVNQKLYDDIHQLAHKGDSCWVYGR